MPVSFVNTINSDDFNRASLGSNYAQLNDAWGTVRLIASTTFDSSGPHTNNEAAAVWVGSGTYTADQYSEVSVNSLAFGSIDYVTGVIVRASTDTNGNRDFYFGFVASDSPGPNYTVAIGKVVNGTRTVLHSAAIAWSNGDRLGLFAVGSTIGLTKNGTELGGSFTQTDTSLTTGNPGLLANGTAAGLGDDWLSGDAEIALSFVLGTATETDAAQPITRKKAKAIGIATETDAAQALTALQTTGISFVGGAVGTNTATLPSFAANDIAIVYAFRDGSTTNPAVPGTFTSITNTTDGTTCSISMGWRRLQSGDTTIGTWTNASRCSVVLYRGMKPSGTPVGAFAAGASSTSNTLDYPALTLTATNGTSWVLRAAGHRSTDQNLETPPSGYTNRAAASGVDATAETAVHDTNGPVSSVSADNVTLTGTSSGRIPVSLELISKIIGGTLGIATETDAAQALTRKKAKAVGIAAETDAAQTIVNIGGKNIAVTPSTETDAAQTIARSKLKALGISSETDAAQSFARAKSRAVGVASETDTAQVFTRSKRRALGIATETDAAQVIVKTGAKFIAVTAATESDAAQAFSRSKRRAVGIGTETDAAQALGRRKSRAVGIAAETDAAQAFARSKLRALGVATETDAAQAITLAAVTLPIHVRAQNRPRPGRGPFSYGKFYVRDSRTYRLPSAPVLSFALGVATETDTAQGITRRKARAVGISTETDAAQTIGKRKTRAVAIAAETDTAQAFARSKRRAVGIATETDAAQTISRNGQKLIAVNVATETDTAQTLPWAPKRRLAAPALESDASMPISRSKRRLAAVALESDSAIALTRQKLRAPLFAGETDTALAFSRKKTRLVQPATELDSALSFDLSGGYSASPPAFVFRVPGRRSQLRVPKAGSALKIHP